MLQTISSSSSALKHGSAVLLGHERAEERIDGNIVRRTHQDEPKGGQIIRKELAEREGISWRQAAVNEAMDRIARNGGFLESIVEDLEKNVEEAERETRKSESKEDGNGEGAARTGESPPETEDTAAVHIDILA